MSIEKLREISQIVCECADAGVAQIGAAVALADELRPLIAAIIKEWEERKPVAWEVEFDTCDHELWFASEFNGNPPSFGTEVHPLFSYPPSCYRLVEAVKEAISTYQVPLTARLAEALATHEKEQAK